MLRYENVPVYSGVVLTKDVMCAEAQHAAQTAVSGCTERYHSVSVLTGALPALLPLPAVPVGGAIWMDARAMHAIAVLLP